MHLPFSSHDKQKCQRNIHVKLVVKDCSVLSCPAFFWTPFVFPDKVKKPVTDKMN